MTEAEAAVPSRGDDLAPRSAETAASSGGGEAAAGESAAGEAAAGEAAAGDVPAVDVPAVDVWTGAAEPGGAEPGEAEPGEAEPSDAEPGGAEPSDAEPGDAEPAQRARRRRLRSYMPAPVFHIGRLLLIALVLEYLVFPQLAGPRKVIHLLTQVNPFLLLAGVGAEVGALLCYAALTRTVLPDAHRIKFFTLFRIEMTTLSVSHCAPGGSAAGTALAYRLLTQSGANAGDAGFALGTQGIGSAVVLNVILWVALIVSIPVWGFDAVYLLAAAVGAVLLIGASGLLYAFTRGEDRVGAVLEKSASYLPFVDGAALKRSFAHLAGRLERLSGQRNVLGWAVVWAMLNWLLDALSLEVMVGAFGHWVNPDGLLVAYGLANVLAAIPITPGGLGVVEATLTTLLVGFGTPRGVATLGVIVYRLINFWLPIPLGALAYLSMRVDRPRDGGGRRIWKWRLPAIRRSPDAVVHPAPATASPEEHSSGALT